jgi:hypothetical protein
MTAQTRSPGRPDMQTVLTMVWDNLLPAFNPGALRDPEGDERLQARLHGLTLPGVLVLLVLLGGPKSGRCDKFHATEPRRAFMT